MIFKVTQFEMLTKLINNQWPTTHMKNYCY